jgi:hypothetical protein
MNKAVLFKIKPGKREQWEKWCLELSTTLKNDALATLHEEKLVQELAISFSINNEDFLLGYAEGENLPANIEKEINMKHKKMKEECLERVSDANILYHFKI